MFHTILILYDHPKGEPIRSEIQCDLEYKWFGKIPSFLISHFLRLEYKRDRGKGQTLFSIPAVPSGPPYSKEPKGDPSPRLPYNLHDTSGTDRTRLGKTEPHPHYFHPHLTPPLPLLRSPLLIVSCNSPSLVTGVTLGRDTGTHS